MNDGKHGARRKDCIYCIHEVQPCYRIYNAANGAGITADLCIHKVNTAADEIWTDGMKECPYVKGGRCRERVTG